MPKRAAATKTTGAKKRATKKRVPVKPPEPSLAEQLNPAIYKSALEVARMSGGDARRVRVISPSQVIVALSD